MLYIMRHAKTDWNISHKLQGRTDIPLNAVGRRMAEQARLDYKQVDIDVCYCSPLKRALETAQIVLKGRNIPIVKNELLIEMGFGSYEGTENCLQIPNCPINVVFQNPEQYTKSLGGSETFQELFHRSQTFLNEVIAPELKQQKNVLIVAHAAINASIICQIKHLPLSEFWPQSREQCKLIKLL